MNLKEQYGYKAWMAAAVTTLMLSSQGVSAVEIFRDDFETCDRSKTTNGFRWDGGVRTTVNTLNPKGGRCALQFTYEAVPSDQDSFSEQRFSLGGYYPEIWVKYDLYVPANYCHRNDSPSNNKAFLYLWEGDYGRPTGQGMGPAFWADGTSCQSATTFAIWGPLGERHYWQEDFIDPISIKTGDLGRWMEVILHYKYATATNNNGIAQIWITSQGQNRRQILNLVNMPWYVQGSRGFDQGYLLGWANGGFSEVTNLYIDNIIFSTDPIGMDPPGVVSATVR